MAMSVLDDKSTEPSVEQVKEVLGRSFASWEAIKQYVSGRCGEIVEQWNFPGAKYGWSMRLKFKKRTILYLIPCHKHFMAAFVFGDRAVAAVEESKLPKSIITMLREARKYAEGRGIRLEIRKKADVEHIKTLTEIKLAN